jgi:predicted Rossmann fold nucleotide-binding protein DprA/Smf involved in DNA uptake
MKVAIVGSRHFPEMERVTQFVQRLPAGAIVVTGGASGVDAATDPSASGRRNQELVDSADVVVAFWDGSSQGTRKTVERALESGREVHVFLPQSPGLG